jgi:two-component system, sensor histidine kinase
MLSKAGIALDIASDGADGVAAALAKHYDVVLMDIQMPNMDGHQAVQALRAKDYTRPIVALTAHAMREERERAERSGFSHFLTKPIDRKNLINLLEVLQNSLTDSKQ